MVLVAFFICLFFEATRSQGFAFSSTAADPVEVFLPILSPRTTTTQRSEPSESATGKNYFVEAEDVRFEIADTSFAAKEFSLSVNDLSQDLLRKMWNDQDNIVFSPLCIHLALAILASGSTTGSKTEMELLRTLGRVQNIQALEQRYRRLLTSYNKVDIKQHLSYSNLLVTSQAYFDDIRGSFLEKLSYHYKSDMMKVKNQNIAENVNSYIHNMTFGNIDTLLGLDDISYDLGLLITNGFYFSANFTLAFEKTNQTNPFHLSNGQTLNNLKMMSRVSEELMPNDLTVTKFTIHGFDFTAVTIPYLVNDNDNRFELILAMPDHRRGFTFLFDFLSTTDRIPDNFFDTMLDEIELQRLKDREIWELAMPDFSFDLGPMSMKGVLSKLELNETFEAGEFDYILDTKLLKVEDIVHRTRFEVTEDGTKDAKARRVRLKNGSFGQAEVKQLVIDKPFLFVLYDNAEKIPLLMGKVGRPPKTEAGSKKNMVNDHPNLEDLDQKELLDFLLPTEGLHKGASLSEGDRQD